MSVRAYSKAANIASRIWNKNNVSRSLECISLSRYANKLTWTNIFCSMHRAVISCRFRCVLWTQCRVHYFIQRWQVIQHLFHPIFPTNSIQLQISTTWSTGVVFTVWPTKTCIVLDSRNLRTNLRNVLMSQLIHQLRFTKYYHYPGMG